MQHMNNDTEYHRKLKSVMEDFVHHVYDVTEDFPKNEIFGITSQLRRASLSVPLNYTEGFARRRKAVLRQFLEIAYGSLKESEYIIHFAGKRGYIKDQDLDKLLEQLDKIGKMLWGIMKKIEK